MYYLHHYHHLLIILFFEHKNTRIHNAQYQLTHTHTIELYEMRSKQKQFCFINNMKLYIFFQKHYWFYFFHIYIFLSGYTLYWNHRNIHVFRPDVECTNGIIHVIDHPFLIDSDVQVTGGNSPLQSTCSILIASIVMAVLAMLFV